MRVLWISCLLIGSITCHPVGQDYRSNDAGTSFMRPPLSYGPVFSGEGMSSSPGSSSSLPSLSSPSFGRVAQLPAPQNALSNAGPGSSLDVYSGNTNMASGVYNPSTSYAAPQSSGYDASAPGGSYGGGYGASAPGGSYGGGYGASAPGASAPGGSYGGGYGASAPGGSYGGGYGASAPGGSYGGGYGSSASAYAGDSYYGYVAPYDESSNSGAGYETPEPVFSDVSDLEPVYYYGSRSSYQRGQAAFAQTRYIPGEPVPPFPVSRRIVTLQPNAPAKAPAKGGF